MLITKQDGSKEDFDPHKLKASLAKAGATGEECKEIIKRIEARIVEGDTTKVIYKQAFKLLKTMEQPLAARYSMRRALRELGPSGFPFEDFVGEIFKAQGFSVQTDIMIEGQCATHELDLLVAKGDTVIGAELKFHNNPSIKSDLKVALYVSARFEDLKKKQEKNKITEGWLVTNTKFTRNATRYGKCVGLKMVSWNYPASGHLQDLIEEAGVQPVTALTTLSRREKTALLTQKLVLCKSLHGRTDVLSAIGLTPGKIEKVLTESQMLCGV